LHLRQVPCLHSVVPNFRCWKRNKYQNLDQDEEGDGSETVDKRQDVSMMFGRIMVRMAALAAIGLTVFFLVLHNTLAGPGQRSTPEEDFRTHSPLIMYFAVLELLVCGACSKTAALMYRRRRHALRHPADSTGKEREGYIKVELEKDAGLEHRQLYGLGYRPSSDGLECLIVEAVRPGSLLDQWNNRAAGPSPEQLLEEALGDTVLENTAEAPEPAQSAPEAGGPAASAVQTVRPGAAIVAVNDVTADVGMMQAQLTQSKVTLWLRSDFASPESELAAAIAVASGAPAPNAPAPTALGRPEATGWAAAVSEAAAVAAGPRCACVPLEDEEQQTFMHWTVCSIIFGWVTLLPVLLTQPHEHRPRQQLFRQYLLKPCLLMLPVAMLLWLLDCIEVMAELEFYKPFYYFVICHVVIPGVLVFYLVQMQAADEKLALEQRKTRLKESPSVTPVVAEDPTPILLKELIEVNPVALVWLGASASIPLVVASFITPLQTERGKKAQSYINIIYTPCAVLQVFYLWVIWRVRFIDLPRLYAAAISLLLSIPCFIVWCFCLMCASSYGREDLGIVEKQRQERAKNVLAAAGLAAPEATGPETPPGSGLVDCSEATRDGVLMFSA